MASSGTTAAADAEVRYQVAVVQDALNLTLTQAETLHSLMSRTSNRAVEAVVFSDCPEAKVKLVNVRRLRGPVTEKCCMGHSISFAFDVVISSPLGPAGEQLRTLGSTCAQHVLDLPDSVKTLVLGLSRYGRLLEDKEMPRVLAAAAEKLKRLGVPPGEIGQRIIDDYRATPEYAEVMGAVRKLKGREREAAQPAAKQRRRDFNYARLCHAVSTVEVCDEGDLPFTPTIVKRVLRGAKRLDELDTQAARRAPAVSAAPPQPAVGASAVTYFPSPASPQQGATPASGSGHSPANAAQSSTPQQGSFIFN